ncbi:MAG: hypothetical protein HC838_08185 [Spirulinaceae cyanobacterium RM2_2_10]|nr:hypothetical protein [Spirulinaceae cyanobacterium RM2_2_10]
MARLPHQDHCLSAVIAAAIKSIAPTLPIAATATNALIAVLTPPLLLVIALVWQSRSPTHSARSE